MFYDADDILPTEHVGRVMNDNKDNKDNVHGIGITSKALGQIYGVAKEAILVSVVTTPYNTDVA